MTTDEKKALKDFLLDINCLKKLDDWPDDFNLFNVLKITNKEIRHSNILAWLLDPNESHGIGDAFLREFISTLFEKIDSTSIDDLSIFLQNLYTYQVYREKNHMDIVLYSSEEKTVIIIENKVWAGESRNQLKKYYEVSLNEYKDCARFYVFLTPYGDKSSEPERWVAFSYEEIVDSLESAVAEINIRPDVALLINHYINTVRKNIMNERDEELARICNDIYNKHRKALRLIFQNVVVDNSIESEIITATLQELSDKGIILYDSKNGWTFSTKQMDALLPPLDTPDSSWGTNYIYAYWLEKTSDDRLLIHLELAGSNLNEDQRKKSKMLIQAAEKKERPNYKFCRLYYKDSKLSQDDYENSLKSAVEQLVEYALKYEAKLLAKYNDVTSDKSSTN